MGIILRFSSIILFVFAFASCATNRIQNTYSSGNLSKIKSEKLKNQEIVCITPKINYPVTKKRSSQPQALKHIVSERNVFQALNKNHDAVQSRTGILNKRKHETDRILKTRSFQVKLVVPETIGSKTVSYSRRPSPEEINPYFNVIFNFQNSLQSVNQIAGIHSTPAESDLERPVGETHLSGLKPLSPVRKENFDITNIRKDAGNPVLIPFKSELQSKPVQKNGTALYMFVLVAGALAFVLLKATPEFSRNLSEWATRNPWRTRFLIGGIHVIMGAAGFILGKELAERGTNFSEFSKYILLTTFAASAALYPVRKSETKLFKHTFIRQKAHDLALILSGFLLMVNLGNHYPNQIPFMAKIIDSHDYSKTIQNTSPGKAQNMTNLVFYQSEKQVQNQTGDNKHNDLPVASKIFLALLALLAFGGLVYGLLILSCWIICSGLEFLGYLVGIAGGVGLFILLILALKGIFKPKSRRVPKTDLA